MASVACPTDALLGAFVEGCLPTEAFAEIERHLDTCSSCRQVISALAVAHRAPASPTFALEADDDDPALGVETQIGRFIIMGMLGRGGMGVVYRAHDPALDRDIALKLLRTDGPLGPGDEAASARLEREAKALARVRHPNVIAVYDVGTFERRVFFTMELVEGAPLSSFISASKRSQAEIIAAFEEAGRGLHAAHEAGLVHRDFKPDNVLMGRDGRILVTDFGLACAEGRPEPRTAHASSPVFAAGTLTRTGALLGTPAYMAPEQRQGGPVSARSDQFSFCVALWEALTGELPFRSLEDRMAGRVTEPRLPSGRQRLSARVRRALLRGLRADPGQRYPSMLALLRDLSPPRSRLWIPAAALALVLAVGAALGVRGRPDVCAAAKVGLPGVWDPQKKQAVIAALLATKKTYAADSAREVGERLDAYAAQWSAMRRDACEATHVRHEQSEELLDRRVRCLDERRATLEALVAILEKGGAVEHAVDAVHALESLGGCADATALLARVPPPREPAARAEADAIDRELGAAQAELKLRDYAAAKRRLDAILPRSRALGHGPTLARTLWLTGLVQSASSDPLTAEPTLREAAHVADAAGDDETRARAWMDVTWLLGYANARVSDGLAADEEARAALARLGGNDELEARRLDGRATLLHSAGRTPEALVDLRHSLAIRERIFGPDAQEVSDSLNRLGSYLLGTGDAADREAVSMLQRSLRIAERFSPAVVVPRRINLLRALVLTSHFEEALKEGRAALELVDATYGPDHPKAALVAVHLALALQGVHRHEEALVELRRAISIWEHAFGPKYPDVAEALVDVGVSLAALHREEEAEASIRKGLAIVQETQPANHPRLAKPLRALGTLRLQQGRPADALAPLRRALALAANEGPATRAEIRFALVRALTGTGKTAEADAEALTTDAEVKAAGDAARPTDAALAAWREERRRER